jgi:large subunit ribosomal protein L24
MKIKKGDNVKIMKGKDRGKTGTVLIASPVADRVTVDGLNMFKKRSKPKKQGETGQIVLIARPLAASAVQLVCPNCKRPTRVGHRSEGNRMVRYCKKCKATI